MKKLLWAIPLIILLLLPLMIDLMKNEEIQHRQYKVSGKINNKQTIIAPLDIILLNNEASNNEDIDAYLSTISKEYRAATQKEIQLFFDTYDIQYVIKSMYVLKQMENRTVVEVVKTAKNYNQEEFQDHQSSHIITLERTGNSWFIVESLINKTQKL